MDHPFVDKVWELSANKVIYYYNYYDCYILFYTPSSYTSYVIVVCTV